MLICAGVKSHPDPYPDHVWDRIHRRKVRVVPNKKRVSPAWIDVRAVLQIFDRAGLIGLVQDLYAVSKDNQAFLHARLDLGHLDMPRPNEKPAHIDF
jgi:hypothetical protein